MNFDQLKNNLIKVESFKKSENFDELVDNTKYHLDDLKEEFSKYNKLHEKQNRE